MANRIPFEAAATPAFALNAARSLSDAPTPAAERAKVAELSQQFEAMLMLQMVQQMRKSLLDESEQPEGLGGTTMQETFDSEFSRYLAQSGGVGLGAFMTRTLDARASESVSPARNRGEPRVVRRCPRPAGPLPRAAEAATAATDESVRRQRRRSDVGRSAADHAP